MNKSLLLTLALIGAFAACNVFAATDDTPREKLNFNQGWKFIRKNVPAAADPAYPIKELERWESVDLPHTVRVEPYTNSGKSYQGPATYVKRFHSQSEWKGKKVFLEFEGVMGVADVWVNGKHLAAKQAQATGTNSNYGGYLPFVLDISEALKFDGTDNGVTVLADNSDNPLVPPGKPQKNLDFSYFGGIYRDVWLHVTNPVHVTSAIFEDIVGGGGIVVEYPSLSRERATVRVKTHVRNESQKATNLTLKQEIVDDETKAVVGKTTTEAVALAANGDRTIEAALTVENPKLWSLETPNLQSLVTTVFDNGVPVDKLETRIGIRTIRITKEKGLEINGEPAGGLSGANLHQEFAYIGYAIPNSLLKRDAIKFKNAGMNVVRTGVYPQDPAFIAACGELGILVLEPTPGWQWAPSDPVFRTRVSQNIQQMIRRDRNNPAILLYEISLNESHPDNKEEFNQISVDVAKAEKLGLIYSLASGGEIWDSQTGVKASIAREYGDYMWAQDGDFKGSGRTERSPDFFYPGGEARMVKQARERMWEGGGQGFLLSQLASHAKNPLHLGGAQWAGIDHNRGYSVHAAACGMLDLFRIPKFMYYLYASQRSVEKDPMVFIASNWTEKVPLFDKVTTQDFSLGTDALRNVDVYSNAARVRLSVIQNGEVKWSKTQEPSVFLPNNKNASVMKAPPFLFVEVPYSKGTLKAEGLNASGKVIASHSVTTAGAPARIMLKADSEGIDLVADGSDIVSIQAYVTDAGGNVCSTAANEITFAVKNGKIIGDGDKRVGSNPVKAVAGIIAVPVQATETPGEVEITASSPGLEGGKLIIPAKPMTQKAAPFVKIAQGELLDQGSTFLANKEKMAFGGVVTGDVKVGATNYEQSIVLEKTSSKVEYYLNKSFERLTGKVGISSADPQASGRAVVFKIYCDGVLKYASKPVAFGQTADVNLNAGGVDELTLVATDAKEAEKTGSAAFLSLYIEEGKNEGIDEREARQNLAPAMKPWKQDFKKGNPVWQIDLGKAFDVRNALLKVQYDSMKYSYEIWTSPDNKKWSKQISKEKTAHNNEIEDAFTARNVRYVKVVFTDVIPVGIDWGKAASITAFEIYKDFGVDSVREFLLKGLAVDGVEGKDLLFSPVMTDYRLEQKGRKSQVTVRALPYDPQATVKINGAPVNNRPGASHIKEATPVTVNLKAGMNKVGIAVTNARGTGTKTYTLNIESDGGNSFNAMECFVPNQNGANGWSYQFQDIKTGEIANITLPMKFASAGNPVFGTVSKVWEYSGPMSMHPGKAVNAVRTFKSPRAGHALINATARLLNAGSVLLRVYKNSTQIHPASGNGTVLSGSEGQIQRIENLPVDLAAGDEIRFVVDPNGANADDATLWDTTVSFQPGGSK